MKRGSGLQQEYPVLENNSQGNCKTPTLLNVIIVVIELI